MTPNLGSMDRVLRFFIGLALLMAPLGNVPPIWTSAIFGFGAMAVGLILIATSLFRFCPLYRLAGISTCKI
ncbi:MAG: DUF2892 domain-containing protein [Arenibacterium sp.]